MEKPALTNLDIHPLLKKRWSPRSFQSKMIEHEKLERIFEASRWAPSSSNEQPWRFILGLKGDDTWDKIYETLVEFNQKWAKLAPVLGVTVGKVMSSRRAKENEAYKYDVGQSIAYATFQATHEGIYIHQMGGLNKEKAAELLKVPEGYKVLTGFTMGYIGEPELLEPNFAEMERGPRERIPLNDLVFTGKFGDKPDWL